MGAPAPLAYPAIDNTLGGSAALVDWFYEDGPVSHIHGGRFMERIIPRLDSKCGKQPNRLKLNEILKRVYNLR